MGRSARGSPCLTDNLCPRLESLLLSSVRRQGLYTVRCFLFDLYLLAHVKELWLLVCLAAED